jgi:hypothetical protein
MQLLRQQIACNVAVSAISLRRLASIVLGCGASATQNKVQTNKRVMCFPSLPQSYLNYAAASFFCIQTSFDKTPDTNLQRSLGFLYAGLPTNGRKSEKQDGDCSFRRGGMTPARFRDFRPDDGVVGRYKLN